MEGGIKRCCEGMKWRERGKEYATQTARERDSDVFVRGA